MKHNNPRRNGMQRMLSALSLSFFPCLSFEDGLVLAVMSPHSCENIHSTRSVARQLLSKEKQKQPALRRAM